MTNLTKIAVITSFAMAIPAYAMSQSASEMDANGDGVLTIDEVQAAFPDTTGEAFSTMDLNADGALDSSEVSAAQDAGLMPATDG
jgi:hypothetical protein